MSERQAIPLAQGGTGYRCAWCERVQPVDQFGQDKARPEGITLHCLTCGRRRSAEARQYDRMGILPVKGRHRDFGRKQLCPECHTLKHRYSFDRGTQRRATICWSCEEAKRSVDAAALAATSEPAVFDPLALIGGILERGISLILQNDKLSFRGGQLSDDEYAAMHLHPVRIKQVVRKRAESMLGENTALSHCISIPAAPPVGALVSHIHFGIGRVIASTFGEVDVEFCDKRGGLVRKRILQCVALMPLIADPLGVSLEEWLDHLRIHDIRVTCDGTDVCIDAPQGTLTPDIKARIMLYKADIQRILQEQTAAETPAPDVNAQQRGDGRGLAMWPPNTQINAALFGFGSDLTCGEWAIALREPAEFAGEFDRVMLSHVSDWGLVVTYRDPFTEGRFQSFLIPWANVAYIHRAADRNA